MCKDTNRPEIVSKPTWYAGVLFRSQLEAWYAAFFDILGWEWEYEPLTLKVNGRNWLVDFRVTIPSKDYACSRPFVLLVEVKPYHSIENKEFKEHPSYPLAMEGYGCGLECDAVALFGDNPEVSYWETTYCGEGSIYTIPSWVRNWLAVWKKAGNMVRWYPHKQHKNQFELWNDSNAYPENACMRCHKNERNWIFCGACREVICIDCCGSFCDKCRNLIAKTPAHIRAALRDSGNPLRYTIVNGKLSLPYECESEGAEQDWFSENAPPEPTSPPVN